MKKTISILAIAVCLTLLFASCEKEADQPDECGQIPAVVLRYDCDRVALKLLTSETIGDSSWTDVHTGNRYENVVENFRICKIWNMFRFEGDTSTIHRFDTIYVSGIKKFENGYPVGYPIDPECENQCSAVSINPPQTKVDFTSISKNPCNRTPSSR